MGRPPRRTVTSRHAHRPSATLALVCAIALTGALAACSGAGDEPPAGPSGTAGTTSTTGAPGTAPGTATGSPGASTTTAEGTTSTTATPTATASDEVPQLEIEVAAEGLSLPWDVQLLPDGTALITERGGRLLVLDEPGAEPREVSADLSDVFVASEAGLMGLAVSPDFEQDRTIFLCYAAQPSDAQADVRVTRWTLDEDVTAATREGVVVDGIPLTSGRHAGCRLLLTPDGDLLVGTGDAADPSNPQDLDSLGGKVLSVTPDGEPTDPGGHVEGADPRILTYGHRNVQGLAVQPGTGTLWEVEHGPDVDDEVNVLQPGANYGWDPRPGYDESVPMTDLQKFPDAVEAVWSSGDPTHATSGATFLDSPQWGAWDGVLAVAELKGTGVTLLEVDGTEVVGTARIPELEDDYGRLRSLTLDPDGALWVTSSNGDGDVVLRITATTG